MQAAADLVGLDITIPRHSASTEEAVQAFANIGPPDGKHPSRGAALAWISHLQMLNYVVANDLDTALILEDDVDWDVRIRSQMRDVSDNVRNFTHTPDAEPAPYGRNWDVLWIGHCGEASEFGAPRLEYPDPTLLDRAQYEGWNKKYLNMTEGNRAVQHAVLPVCTFGYAMTRMGAEKILDWAGKGQEEAFDARLFQGCKYKHLDCVVVNPELMHHYQPPNGIGYESDLRQADGASSRPSEFFEDKMGTTPNIALSSRCQALWGQTCVAS